MPTSYDFIILRVQKAHTMSVFKNSLHWEDELMSVRSLEFSH